MLGLSILASLGLVASMASGAQAAAEWKINTVKLTGNESIGFTPVTEFLIVVPSKTVVIHCANLSIDEGKILGVEVKMHGNMLINGCITLIAGKTVPQCFPINTPVPMPFKASLLPHNAKTYLLFEAQTAGEPLMRLKFEGACTLPEEVKITGTFVAECLTAGGAAGSCTEELVAHNIRPSNTGLFAPSLFWNLSSATTFEGIIGATLTGANLGKKWSGVL